VSSGEQYDSFFSHSHADGEAVRMIAEVLEERLGIRIWLDRWRLVPGEEWQHALAQALDEAATCAIFLGKETPTGWFDQEIQRALNRHARDKRFRVIPVLLPESDSSIVDNFLELRSWVEFKHGFNDEQALHLLGAGIQGIAPGRTPTALSIVKNPAFTAATERLRALQQLHKDALVADEVALEFQRKILDKIFEVPD
jgi:TIR domain